MRVLAQADHATIEGGQFFLSDDRAAAISAGALAAARRRGQDCRRPRTHGTHHSGVR